MNFLKEFKEFAMRGNVVDLAVGVIIGASFGKIVGSLVADVINPVIGVFLGKVDFSRFNWRLAEGVEIHYGRFINTLIDFTIVAFVMFLVIKAVNRLRRQEPPPPAAPTPQEKLLTEIRDILARR